jgi:uncharacterized protein (DUF427 family)
MSDAAVLEAAGIATEGYVHLRRHDGVVEAWNGSTLVASSARVIELHEVDVPTRLYFPREDVRLEELRSVENATFCPFKGVADDYWALRDDHDDALVAWSYPAPISAFAPIAGHVAFYDSIAVRPAG